MRYTRFERARMIGARALQISMGAPTSAETASTADALQIAFTEFATEKTHLTVTRVQDALD